MPTAIVSQALHLPEDECGPALLELEEDQWFDRKSPRISARALADVEIGFANAEGGTIVIGLQRGRVEGTNRYAKRRNELVQAAIDHTEPPVRVDWELIPCLNDRGTSDQLLVLEVQPSLTVHANKRDELFLRVGDENRKLNFRQRQELLYDKGQAAFDGSPIADVSMGDLDKPLLDSYADALEVDSAERLLKARGLINPNGVLTAAAVLVFGENPQIRFPEAYVRVVRYRGTERGTGRAQQIIRDTRHEGPIPQILHDAAEEIRSLQPTRRALSGSGRFGGRGLIPEDAWLEGLVNAVVHRSYSIGGDHIRVEIFDDRMEIESPGRFPGLVDPKDPLKITRFARNPRIARVCADLDFGQELGEGIRRIYAEMRGAGLGDPLYRQPATAVQLTLSGMQVDRELLNRLPPRSGEVLAALRQAERMSTGDLADLLEITRPSILVRLRALEEQGLIEWVGSSPKDPRAYWRVRR